MWCLRRPWARFCLFLRVTCVANSARVTADLSIKSAPDWSGISGPGFFTRLQSGPGFWDFCNFRWDFFTPNLKKISTPSAPNSLSLPSGATPKFWSGISGPGFLSSLQSGPGFWDIPDHLVRDFILRDQCMGECAAEAKCAGVSTDGQSCLLCNTAASGSDRPSYASHWKPQ